MLAIDRITSDPNIITGKACIRGMRVTVCPAISNNTMKIVDALLRQQKKHLLLWIYN